MEAKRTWGATFLVSGCCIGAGMIGLPVKSALAGFLPSSLAMGLCYLFTTMTGLLLLEATLWFDGSVNLPSIVEKVLGKGGKALTLVLFLFLFGCLFVAYLDGGGALFAEILSALFGYPFSRVAGILTCLGFVGGVTYAGTRLVDGLNRGLLLGLGISYVILVLLGLPRMQAENLGHADWKAMIGTIPLLLICFGYQNLVPSLCDYLGRNLKALRFAIIVGNLIPLLFYLLWDVVILGLLSPEQKGLTQEATMVSELLQGAAQSVTILFFIKSFSLFAILTSFLPSAMSCVDFLKDGFKETFHTEQKNKGVLYALVFIPPLLCSLLFPHLFLRALSFAGGFIDIVLFGILPAMVILIGRRVKKMKGPYQVFGGVWTPAVILALSVMVLFLKRG